MALFDTNSLVLTFDEPALPGRIDTHEWAAGGGGSTPVPPVPPPPAPMVTVVPQTTESLGTTGSDISTFPELDPSMTPVSDSRVLAEALARRFLTPRGSLSFHPDYGLDIRSYLNEVVDDQLLHRLKSDTELEALQDERIESATAAVSYDDGTQKLTVKVTGTAATGTEFKFTLDVTKLTDTLLAEG